MRRTGECGAETFLALGKKDSPEFSISMTGDRLDVEVLGAVRDRTNRGGAETRRGPVNQWVAEFGAKKNWLPVVDTFRTLVLPAGTFELPACGS